MNPASAMSFALKNPGRAALVCANAKLDFETGIAIAASAAERTNARFVIIGMFLGRH